VISVLLTIFVGIVIFLIYQDRKISKLEKHLKIKRMSKNVAGHTSFFENVEHYFDKAAGYLNYDPGLLSQIKTCNSVYQMHFPVVVEDKKTGKKGVEVVEAYRFSIASTRCRARGHSFQS